MNDAYPLDDEFLYAPFVNDSPLPLPMPDSDSNWPVLFPHSNMHPEPWNSTFKYADYGSRTVEPQPEPRSHRDSFDLQQIQLSASHQPCHPQVYTPEMQADTNPHVYPNQNFDVCYVEDEFEGCDPLDITKSQVHDIDSQLTQVHHFSIPFRVSNPDYDERSGSWVVLNTGSMISDSYACHESIGDEAQCLIDDIPSLATPSLMSVDLTQQSDEDALPWMDVNDTYSTQRTSLDIVYCGQWVTSEH